MCYLGTLVLGNVTGVALIPRSTILPEALKVTDPRNLGSFWQRQETGVATRFILPLSPRRPHAACITCSVVVSTWKILHPVRPSSLGLLPLGMRGGETGTVVATYTILPVMGRSCHRSFSTYGTMLEGYLSRRSWCCSNFIAEVERVTVAIHRVGT
jgi:hypothetical protein